VTTFVSPGAVITVSESRFGNFSKPVNELKVPLLAQFNSKSVTVSLAN